ncbi:Uveal autoantigen with coiled-coil domains and ankyrin repeats isoform 1 [Senna tora]|uniref:Uveal autoantigen with coiled-coil domains and ankyrin repeats isoform 1 n=1 Tax=Senna tora TaxID=362788 RepID=A0A835CFM6_9FABA|nr:Uveal autoantigen with coiled-coil domains and ankyrin repeats isoform 1 [Senna tora]
MVYSYTPTYYSTLHDSITSLCKSILPFSSKKRCLPPAEQRLSELQSDNLKWQQDSFHQMLNLMGLHREGILAQSEVSRFRTHLLETLIASPLDPEYPVVLRDKLLFLQELLYAKCISEEEYHSSKRPLIQRLAVQGAEIEARDVIVREKNDTKEKSAEEEWSVIDLKDERSFQNKENINYSIKKAKPKHIKESATSVFSFVSSTSSHKPPIPKNARRERSIFDDSRDESGPPEPIKNRSILMEESGPPGPIKRRPFRSLFLQREQRGEKQWGFDGFKRWKKSETENGETDSSEVFARTLREGPDTKLMKKMMHSDGSPSDFFIDKVLGERIKKELSTIQTELSTTNPSLQLSTDQIEAISTKLPVEKAELQNYFPKSWCERYGDVVLDVVKKEFKEHVGEMENMRHMAREKHRNNSKRWTTTFQDDHEIRNPFRSSSGGINPYSFAFTDSKRN